MTLISMVLLLLAPAAEGQIARGTGDFEFFLDTTALPLEDGMVLELFQVAIPVKEIKYEEEDGSFLAAVKVALVLRKNGEAVHEKGLVIRDSRDSRPAVDDLSGFIYMSDSCTVAPGVYTLDVKVEDLNRRKKTLLGMIRKNFDFSEIADIEMDISGFPHGRAALSDPILLWSRESGGQFVTNPMQIYGLKNDTLSFFASALLPDTQKVDSIEAYLSVIDMKGETVGSMSGTVPVRGRRALVFGAFDVNEWPAGNYIAKVDIMTAGSLRASSAKDFSIAWELLNWQKPRRDVLVEARIIFRDAEFEEFRRMSIGEQERVLAAFWKNVDPTPHTAVNEIYDVFQSRVRFADSRFGGGGSRGALSDRGQLYIRLGPPDEIIEESVPFNREDLNETLEKLEDEYKVVIHSTVKGPGTDYAMWVETTSNVNRPYRGGGADTGGYELWIYSMRGDPLLESDRIMMSGSGMRYLFVDKDGVGNYKLVGTSEEVEGFGPADRN